jgi:hypothetical protein
MKNIPLASLEFLKECYDKKEKNRMGIMQNLVCRSNIPDITESVNTKLYIKQSMMGVKRRRDCNTSRRDSFAIDENSSSNMNFGGLALRGLAERISCANKESPRFYRKKTKEEIPRVTLVERAGLATVANLKAHCQNLSDALKYKKGPIKTSTEENSITTHGSHPKENSPKNDPSTLTYDHLSMSASVKNLAVPQRAQNTTPYNHSSSKARLEKLFFKPPISNSVNGSLLQTAKSSCIGSNNSSLERSNLH